MYALVAQIDIKTVFEEFAQKRGQYHNLQNARGHHAEGHGLNAHAAGKHHRGDDERNTQRKTGKLGGHIPLPGIEHRGNHDGYHKEGQARHHDLGQLGGKILRLKFKSRIDQFGQRIGQGIHDDADHNRGQRRKVHGIAGKPVGPLFAYIMKRLHIKRHQRRGDT